MPTDIYNVMSYNGSGSTQRTSGSIAAGTNTLTVTNVIDFKVNQGIAIYGAGPGGSVLLEAVKSINTTTKVITLYGNANTTVTNAIVEHDDQTAVELAAAAARNAGGGVVYFPKGTYLTHSINFGVYDNVTFRGSSAHASILQSHIGTTMLRIRGSNIVIENLTLQSTRDVADDPETKDTDESTNILLSFEGNNSNIKIRNNIFTGKTNTTTGLPAATGIEINSKLNSNIEIVGNVFDNLGYGFLVNDQANDLHDVLITNNKFTNISGDAIELNHPIQIPGYDRKPEDAGYNYVISNNIITANLGKGTTAGFGIGIAGATRVCIMGNQISNFRRQGIHLEDYCRYITITGNVVTGTNAAPDPADAIHSGIYSIDSDYVTISNNEVTSCSNYGIHLDYSDGTQTQSSVISNNIVKGCKNGGISYGANVQSDVIISNNIVENNTGSGIVLLGDGRNVKVVDNICRLNSEYGLKLAHARFGLDIRGNSFYDNTAGDINHGGFLHAVPVKSAINVFESAVSATMDPATTKRIVNKVNGMYLGICAEGLLFITAREMGSVSNMDNRMYKLSWNGTSLAVTELKSKQVGNLIIQTPTVNNSYLQINAVSGSSSGKIIWFEMQFEGMIMHM
ncbi:right-handed parallel beta-helix repeat-containing protein [Paenibacillus ehimensis]|uniref:right-handed parallel beta-helix repeat-containing protein n=1 Tax=Paenibacillus ehimensis TaxID=79264 RepID=UPI000470D7D6|nr:right-handed parallel beta-helix repeat-containing protein [Paenibacillus ehimensis]